MNMKGRKEFIDTGRLSRSYDGYGNCTSMTAYRMRKAPHGDTATRLYDEATGLLVAKAYADGKGPVYTYTQNGNLATRTWARGVVTACAYDGWNSLTNTAYSDGTPSISLSYDAIQVSATDAAEISSDERKKKGNSMELIGEKNQMPCMVTLGSKLKK